MILFCVPPIFLMQPALPIKSSQVFNNIIFTVYHKIDFNLENETSLRETFPYLDVVAHLPQSGYLLSWVTANSVSAVKYMCPHLQLYFMHDTWSRAHKMGVQTFL